MSELASERYEIEIRPASRLRRIFAPVTLLVAGFFAHGAVATNPGGRTFVVKDRATGEVLFSRREPMADDQTGLLAALQQDLETLLAEQFVTEWPPA